jgi:hypothetical protein
MPSRIGPLSKIFHEKLAAFARFAIGLNRSAGTLPLSPEDSKQAFIGFICCQR